MSALRLCQVIEIADRLFPFEAAEPWDNCGLQIGDPERFVYSIAFSLDPTPQTIRFAADLSCELLITHHPVLLEPIRSISEDQFTGRTLLTAARAGVDILALHTNFDAAGGGLNDDLASRLGLRRVITPSPATCARLGELDPAERLLDLADRVGRDLGIVRPRTIAREDCQVRRVFCASGSGMGYLGTALLHKADVMITGDVRYHAAREALEMGMPVIDAGHFGLEKTAATLLAERFREEFAQMGLEIACYPCTSEKDPFLETQTGKEGDSVERATWTPSTASGNRLLD